VSDLPEPSRERWQPLRAGLVNLFHYDEEVFPFRDGHLLLRGNNGTGKSKVLALTLPFLLDGRLSPARVEPDGDPGKRMEWNLLLGGKYPERQGYAWLELGRRHEDGSHETLTLGCGLRAVAGRAVQSWFFITGQRMGRDLHLLDEHDRTLGKERLREVLAEEGSLFDTAAAYRRAVDEALFQLGTERYETLLNLLIQLRQPQLSKRPDEKALSHALTEALPPVHQALLDDVAEAFRNLDVERDELRALEEARAAVDEFLHHYRHYARVATRRMGHNVRRAQSQYEKSSANLTHARDAQIEALREEKKRQGEEARIAQALRDARTGADALRASPEMDKVHELKRCGEEAEKESRRLREAGEEEKRIRGEVTRKGERLRRAHDKVKESRGRVESAAADLTRAAEAARWLADHQALTAPLQLPDGPAGASARTPELATVAAGLTERCEKRQRGLTHLTALNLTVAGARAAHDRAHERREREHAGLREREEAHLQAEASAADAGRDLVDAVRAFLGSAAMLGVPDSEAVLGKLADWVESLDGGNPAQGAVDDAYRMALQRLSAERAGLESHHSDLERERAKLEAERARLEAGEHAEPVVPYTRGEGVREARDGAPLWKLVEFREAVAPKTRAALEAALEAAGLLDAWVMPGGALLAPGTWDAVLLPEAPAARNLSEVLEPAVDRGDPRVATVTDELLQRLLAAIGWGESDHPAWADGSGRWRLGPAQGAWSKEEAAYIGRGAREAARRRRLAVLAELLEALRVQLDEVAEALGELGEHGHTLEQERRAFPSDVPLRAAHDRLAERFRDLSTQRERLERADQALAEARERLHEQTRVRDEAAQDLGLPTDEVELAALESATRDYRAQAGAFWPTLREHWENRHGLGEATAELAEATERLEAQKERLQLADSIAQEARVRFETLKAAEGATAAETLARLDAMEAQIKALEEEGKEKGAELTRLAGRLGGLREEIARHEEALRTHQGEREKAVQALQGFADNGLLLLALPELELPERTAPWAPDPAVRLARRMEQLLAEVADDDEAWIRQQRTVLPHITTLQSALGRHGHQASGEQVGELLLVRVVFQGSAQPPDELQRNLAAEVDERRLLLDKKERELLENYLIDEVASHLQTLVADAERTVERMNAELKMRPTSTGMRLRLVWKPLDEGEKSGGLVAPGGLAEVRRRLRQLAEAWSPQDREAVGQFLQQRITEARQTDQGGTLVEILQRALDYRHWHRFVVERWQDGRWRPAYGPASGGERALVVTIPLFAAASSHYGSAGPHAPRLVMLDEAFAGIDDDSRAKCMGLLAQFDLDFMMTSEREWGCYADLPGLAIAQLVRREDLDAVFVSRWYWDGKRRHKAPDPMLETAAEAETEEAQPEFSLE
jgi:uncharacterized protein (TIGR02680 family)